MKFKTNEEFRKSLRHSIAGGGLIASRKVAAVLDDLDVALAEAEQEREGNVKNGEAVSGLLDKLRESEAQHVRDQLTIGLWRARLERATRHCSCSDCKEARDALAGAGVDAKIAAAPTENKP